MTKVKARPSQLTLLRIRVTQPSNYARPSFSPQTPSEEPKRLFFKWAAKICGIKASYAKRQFRKSPLRFQTIARESRRERKTNDLIAEM